MKRLINLSILFLLSQNINAQTPRFVNPIGGVYGQDYIIVNYVDWEFTGILDHACGNKTYNDHQGTDFTLKSFPQMDAGVDVFAVDTGIVTAVHDGEFDRETIGDTTKGFGNFVALKHSGDLYTYYAHLKKNSLLPVIGETVLPGQKIAEVASSGNSTDPHLHFELWFDSLQLIDPFMGPCGNTETYWLDPLPYDDSYNLWESGMLDFQPTLDDLRERPEETYIFHPGSDTTITFWNLQYGLREGDISRVDWIAPDGSLWFSWDYIYENDFWYYYFWSYINMPPPNMAGDWKVLYFVNNELKKETPFQLSVPNSIDENKWEKTGLYYSNNSIKINSIPDFNSNIKLEIFDLLGHHIISKKNK